MALYGYSAQELFDALVGKEDFLLLDVRNDEEFGRFKVESPFTFSMINVPYMEFIEHEEQSVARVPRGRPLRIVCAKEGSARFVGEILVNAGFDEVGYLQGGIKSWGNLLTPVRINPNGAYALYQFRRPGKASCSYVLHAGDEMMVFDPAKNIAAYQAFAEQHKARIVKTIETHRQADYISGSMALQRAAGVEIIAPEADFSVAKFSFTPARDGAVIPFATGGPQVRVVHTPGHTPGSTSYLIDDRYLITGDTVFIASIGRPDLGGQAAAWSKMLFNTMRNIIGAMADDTVVLPGHYMEWSEANADLAFALPLGEIKRRNADIYGMTDETQFYQFIKSNIRPQPEEYARIRDINAGLETPDEEEQDVLDLGKNECAASAMAKH